jgi:pimeloyl-ACP methyl ester carboxylesterase
MSKQVFVLLHGSWHTPRIWNRIIALLDTVGYSAIAPALPSTGSTPPTPDWSGDIETIRKTVSDLVQEHDVIVVMSSFSGMTGGTALEGLDKQACVSRGLKGGVVRLIFINAFIVPEGFQHSRHGTQDDFLPEMKTDVEVSSISSHLALASLNESYLSGRYYYYTTRERQSLILSRCRRRDR